MFPTKAQIAAIAVLLAVSGCHRPPPSPAPSEASPGDAGYVAPPAATAVERSVGGVVLSGLAPAGASVRLALPNGEALVVRADGRGRWRLALPGAREPRIFGLSAEIGGRRIQGEGYLLVGPRGQAALLRAGAAALRLDHLSGSRITSLDFDGDGGALLSGWAAGGTDVAVRLDGHAVGEARADDDGRFLMALPRLAPGPHRIEATGAAFTDVLAFDAAPAAPLVDGPLRIQFTSQGFRADWLTPGGGVQSTILAG